MVSGMRTSTLLTRLPYLPKADAYASEGGGRIFYPKEGSAFRPKPFDSETESSPDSFDLYEDSEWRKKMELSVSPTSYQGNNVDDAEGAKMVAISERKGVLWEYAQELESRGLILDTKGYSTCFRVNTNHQTKEGVFEEFASNKSLPVGLSSSENLGCIDVYPSDSGKKNW